MKRLLPVSLTLVLVAALTLMEAPAASAATGVVTGTSVTITGGSGDDAVSGFCQGGGLSGGGDVTFPGGGIACTDLTAITVNPLGGNDGVDLSGLNSGAFPALVSVTVSGGEGDDIIIGTPQTDSLAGGNGNDTVAGSGGVDVLAGNGGTGDRIVDQTGLWTNATLTDSSLTLTGGGGSDTLSGFEAASLSGTGLANTIDTTAFTGDAFVFGNGGPDTIMTGSGDDLLAEGTGSADISAGGGDDTINMDIAGADALLDIVDGEAGTDTLVFSGTDLVISPGTIASSNMGTTLISGIEDLFVQEAGGTSTAAAWNGGTVSWYVTQNSGTITGSPGVDIFEPTSTVEGSFDGGAGTDVMKVLAGPDTNEVIVTDTQVTMVNDSPNHTGDYAGIERFTMSTDNDVQEVDLRGFQGTTQVTLDAGSNHVMGSDQRDVILTGKGKDTILAGGGNDKMNGGSKTDVCKGGPGHDTAIKCEKGKP